MNFYCPKLDLIVEIDGISHNVKIEYDKIREKYLKSLNLNIIHFDDIEIKTNLDSVMKYLRQYCINLMKNTQSLRDTYTEEISNTPSLPEGKSTPLKEGNFEEMSVEELAELEV